MRKITLDDSSYEQLFENAVSRIPKLCPEWENTRYSDTGTALLQVMAALADMQNYHLDSVSERHKNSYLRLLGGYRRGVKCARVSVSFDEGISFKKGERVNIGGHVFEYSRKNGADMIFIQKETLVSYHDAAIKDNEHLRTDNNVKAEFFLKQKDRWIPLDRQKTNKINGAVRTVFYSPAATCVLGETDGSAMSEFALPYENILPCCLRLWVNYGGYYVECGFTQENNSVVLGNGRDFPVPAAGGKVEAYSMVLTDGRIRISPKRKVMRNGEATENNEFEVLSSGFAAETSDEALLRISKKGFLYE